MSSGKNRELKKTKIEIIPMIDTMFFLLVFFILSSLGIVKLQGIKIDLPQPGPPQNPNSTPPPPPCEMLVVLGADRTVTVDGQLVPGPNPNISTILQKRIAKDLGATPDFTKADVIISADPSVPQGMVVTCIDQARDVGVKNFAITPQTDAAAPNTAPPPAAGATAP